MRISFSIFLGEFCDEEKEWICFAFDGVVFFGRQLKVLMRHLFFKGQGNLCLADGDLLKIGNPARLNDFTSLGDLLVGARLSPEKEPKLS